MSPDASDAKSRIDPQLAAAMKKAQELSAAFGPPKGIADVRRMASEGRKWWNEGGPAVAKVSEQTVPGPLRDIPVVVYHPKPGTKLPVFVYLHGGGWKIGNEWSNDRQMREIAAAWGGVVVSADYAHVPEHVFPKAVEEAATVYRFLAANGARWNIDGNRIAFGGASAGANVSCGAANLVGGIKTDYLKAGALIVGALDTDTETDSMRSFGVGKDALYPPRDEIIANAEAYVPNAADRADPRFNCVSGDISVMPPLYLAAAELDPLRDSSKNMAKRLAAAGRPHKLKIYPGMTHLFFGYTKMVDRAAECARDIAGFLSEHLPAR
jgi:acetyl esterase